MWTGSLNLFLILLDLDADWLLIKRDQDTQRLRCSRARTGPSSTESAAIISSCAGQKSTSWTGRSCTCTRLMDIQYLALVRCLQFLPTKLCVATATHNLVGKNQLYLLQYTYGLRWGTSLNRHLTGCDMSYYCLVSDVKCTNNVITRGVFLDGVA